MLLFALLLACATESTESGWDIEVTPPVPTFHQDVVISREAKDIEVGTNWMVAVCEIDERNREICRDSSVAFATVDGHLCSAGVADPCLMEGPKFNGFYRVTYWKVD